MSLFIRRLDYCLGILSIAALLCIWFFYTVGIRINTSNSVPVGVYLTNDRPVLKGEYVMFCPNDSLLLKEAQSLGIIHAGFCAGHYGYLIKQVYAVAGDIVSSANQGVIVNGRLLPYSRPLAMFPHWRARNYQLKDDELLVMTNQNPHSFDARYFGVISKSQIQAVLTPVMTWPLPTFYTRSHLI